MPITLQWLGHAAFKIKTDDKVIYIDPRYMKKFASQISPYFEKPDKADIILFTHHHADHCYPSSISKMRTSNTIYIGPEKCYERIGKNLKIIKSGKVIQLDNIKIRAVEAYNIKRHRVRGNLFHPKGLGVGYLIIINGITIYHAGDTENIPEMKQLEEIDVALLPIGDKFTMSIEEAIEVAMMINPIVVIPMHNHDSKPELFKKKLEDQSDIKVAALKIGESYIIN